jgi:hypothetical protein
MKLEKILLGLAVFNGCKVRSASGARVGLQLRVHENRFAQL